MTAPATDAALYAAKPSFAIDGTARPALGQGCLELSTEETSAGLCHCEATFLNWGPRGGGTGYLYFDRQLLDFGKRIAIEAGGGVGAGPIFDGRVTGLEGRFLRQRPHEILVLAEDRLQDLRMTRRTRTFEQISDADLFRQLASQHGLQAQVNVTGPTHRLLAQVNQSDLAFLRERARAIDAELWVEGTNLVVQRRDQRRGATVPLNLGRGLLECTIAADLAGQVSGFTVTGWDVSAKQTIRHRAADAALAGELGSGTAGGGILSSALGTRDQQVVHLLPLTTLEAQALAEAHYRQAARRFVSGEGLAETDARIRVGGYVELHGVGPLFQGEYYVTRVRHVFDPKRGMRTQFAFERPGLGR
jgi:hypothetical protein